MKTDWILTYTGKHFFPLEPNCEDIDILDIAHALSNICRFTGHCREFYSVAQHSVMVAELLWNQHLDYEMALAGLLHDASEAYLIDVARPVKHSPDFEFYRTAEAKLQNVINDCFNCDGYKNQIKGADSIMLATEAYFLMPDCRNWSATTEKPFIFDEFVCWSPQKSKNKFLSSFLDYNQKKLRK
jgi:uncharacterized protein